MVHLPAHPYPDWEQNSSGSSSVFAVSNGRPLLKEKKNKHIFLYWCNYSGNIFQAKFSRRLSFMYRVPYSGRGKTLQKVLRLWRRASLEVESCRPERRDRRWWEIGRIFPSVQIHCHSGKIARSSSCPSGLHWAHWGQRCIHTPLCLGCRGRRAGWG